MRKSFTLMFLQIITMKVFKKYKIVLSNLFLIYRHQNDPGVCSMDQENYR